VAELVVHALETIDVDEQQCDGGPGPRRHQELVLPQRKEPAPVRQTGEVVHGRVSLELHLGLGQVHPGADERAPFLTGGNPPARVACGFGGERE